MSNLIIVFYHNILNKFWHNGGIKIFSCKLFYGFITTPLCNNQKFYPSLNFFF